MKEILNKKTELTQSEIIKVLESLVHMEQTGALMMASQMQMLLSKSINNIVNDGQEAKDFDSQLLFFLIRFWGNFLNIPNADKIVNEELLKKSIEVLQKHMQTVNDLSPDGSPEASKHIGERDVRNVLNIIDFCVKHDNFPSAANVKELMNEILIDFEHNAYKYKQET